MVDYEVYSKKLSLLIHELGINMSKLAEGIHISASHLSKICAGQVKPRSPVYIAEGVAEYVTSNYAEIDDQSKVKKLIWGDAVEPGRFSSGESYRRNLKKWLLNGENEESVLIENLLYKYDGYDKETYLSYSKNIELAVNTIKSKERDSQLFTGMDGLVESVIAWMDKACNSKVNDEIFIFDEIFLALARADYKIAFKWITAIEKLIKSGKKITHVHNLENNLTLMTKEMLLVLPLTMSNRVQHYFINEDKENLYRNMLFVSSESVLLGNAVDNDPDCGYYMEVTSPKDIEVARLRAKRIIKIAEQSHILFDNEFDFEEHMKSVFLGLDKDDTVYIYLPTPAVSSMGKDMLKSILKKNNISPEISEIVLRKYHKECVFIEKFLQQFNMDVSIDYITADRWDKTPQYIIVNEEGVNLKIPYDYDEYEEHIAKTREFVAAHDSIKVNIERMNFFNNMIVIFVPEKYAASITLDSKMTNTSTVKKPIIDSIEELMYVITPSNAKGVQENENRIEILQFYKGLVE